MQNLTQVLEEPQTTGHRLPAGWTYYISHFTGWTLYGVLQYLLFPGPRVIGIALNAVWCGSGMFCTHAVRWYTRRQGWQTIRQFAAPLTIAVLVIAAVMNTARSAVSTLVFHQPLGTAPARLFMVHYISTALIVSVWCGVFLVANEAQRRRLAETEALRLALMAQVLQFRALRSQLNPHFLFNCLNSLRELIDEDRNRAKQVIDLLSALLRYTLHADRIETVSLGEELRVVEDYLQLEKIRFEERLSIRLSIDPQSLEAKLPPMLLQTLAENGVKHGIAHLPAGGELSIKTEVQQGTLRVEVTNTGVLLRPANEDSPAVGLDNARERLRLMYGERASLTLTAADERSVCAAVTIPFRGNGFGS